MPNDPNTIPLTLENINAFFDGSEYGHYRVGTIDPIKETFKGEPNKSGNIKEELTKRLEDGTKLYFQYEIVY